MASLNFSTFGWVLELCLAFLIVIGEVTLELFWMFFPSSFIQKYFVENVFPEYTSKDPDYFADIFELADRRGVDIETCYCTTSDGYLLGVHRVKSRTYTGKSKGVVFMQHGFIMCSEIWFTAPAHRCLPKLLADQGYDVWLGNNRGNKYSYKHMTLSTKDDKFWDFCIDDMALIDVPEMIEFVLNSTGAKTLTYIGFSQGTAIGFALFSSRPEIARKINKFIALAPTTVAKKLNNRLVAALSVSRPQWIFLLLGKQRMLAQHIFWRKVLAMPMLVWSMDVSMRLLFGWHLNNLGSTLDKANNYMHLFSFSSTKTCVHWFQIINQQRFQMYDPNIRPKTFNGELKAYVLPEYYPGNVKCPVALFVGGADTIPDSDLLLSQVPKGTYVHKEKTYEHLDFLWALDVEEKVFPHVLRLVDEAEGNKQ